jgi:hypothetical protein
MAVVEVVEDLLRLIQRIMDDLVDRVVVAIRFINTVDLGEQLALDQVVMQVVPVLLMDLLDLRVLAAAVDQVVLEEVEVVLLVQVVLVVLEHLIQ